MVLLVLAGTMSVLAQLEMTLPQDTAVKMGRLENGLTYYLCGGGLIGIIAMFVVAKHMRNPLEMLAYWIATWGIASYGVWFVIDLIDMEREASRARVLEEMNLVVLTDPVKCVVHGFTSLGLLEMTRKKPDVAPYHHQTQAAPCPHCGGTGLIAEGNAHDTEDFPG